MWASMRTKVNEQAMKHNLGLSHAGDTGTGHNDKAQVW